MTFLRAIVVLFILWIGIAHAGLREDQCDAFCQRLADYDARLSNPQALYRGKSFEDALGDLIAELYIDNSVAAGMALREEISFLVTPRNNDAPIRGFAPKRPRMGEEEISLAALGPHVWRYLQMHMPDRVLSIAAAYSEFARGVRNAELGQLLLGLLNQWSECACDRNLIRGRLHRAMAAKMWELESQKIENFQPFSRFPFL